ncbi:MAG: M28 family peptidase [Deltaproteobacteria bacterium]|nr:M28 family peptidase [Deltaproteobacteria bacterium]
MESRAQIIEKMQRHIEWVCDRIGPRFPCSEGERKLGEYIKAQWDKRSEQTVLQEFTCHPDAYFATFRWPIALFIISLCLYHLLPLLSLLCSTLSVLILVFNMMRNVELIDWLFPTKKSCNVFARFNPQASPERTVIISCHHDSHVAFPILNRFGARYSLFMAMIVFSNVILLLLTLSSVLFSAMGHESFSLGYQKFAFPVLLLLTATLPVQLYTFLRVLSEEPVLGANDNLTGVAVCLALADYLSAPENKLARTAVWLVSFGCEEIGIRGSKRFIKRYGEEIRDAHVLNLDMVGGKGTELQVVTKEEKNLISLSRKMVNLVQEVARESRIPLKTGPIIAFTDAMAFAMKGIEATSLIALDKEGIADTYHSVEDIPDNLDYSLLFDSYRLCVAFLKHADDMPFP